MAYEEESQTRRVLRDDKDSLETMEQLLGVGITQIGITDAIRYRQTASCTAVHEEKKRERGEGGDQSLQSRGPSAS